MYCIQCGVKLADSQTHCPLCGLRVYHPDLPKPDGQPPYPAKELPALPGRSKTFSAAATIIVLLPLLLVLLADLQKNGRVTWSGFVIGALLVGYVMLILPVWFTKPNPVIFTPCACGTILLYLLYIDLATPGRWFLSFALPVGGAATLILTAAVTLTRYLHKGRLYIFGGCTTALGGLFLLSEFLMILTFPSTRFTGWSLYPMITLVILGGTLIFLGICRSARQAMHRRLFF